jgi:hypothetical protein
MLKVYQISVGWALDLSQGSGIKKWCCWRCRCCLFGLMVYADNTVYTVFQRSLTFALRHCGE